MLEGHNEMRRQVNCRIYEIHLLRNLSPPPQHTHIRTNRCMHTSWTSVLSAFLSYLTYLIPSFLPLLHPVRPSIPSSHRKIKPGTKGRNNPPNKGAKRTRDETSRIYSYRQISSHQFIMVTPLCEKGLRYGYFQV